MNHKSLLIGTHNPGKKEEIKKFLEGLDVEILVLDDVGITKDVEETEDSLEGNSRLKAVHYAKKSGLPTIADDGGLEIYALDMEPGVKSRRWIDGETDSTDEELIDYTLYKLKDKHGKERKARLRAVVTFALPNGEFWQEEASTEGVIAEKPAKKATKGYPYRWLLYIPELGKYYNEQELSEEEEIKYNHRRRAIEGLKAVIEENLS